MPPERLFKYTSTDAASAILSNQTLQWSSPDAFNDPFDLKNYFHIDFSWSDLRKEALKKLTEMVLAREEPTFADDNEFVPHIRWLREHLIGESPEYIKIRLEPGFTTNLIEKMMAEGRKFWIEERQIVRILCLAERPDNLLMWSHYAQQHAGVVLEFETKLLEQSASSHAIPVVYSDVVPTPFTYQQFLDWLLGQKGFPDVSEYPIALAFSKSTDWSYEREWRFLKYEDPPKSGRHSYFAFPADALVRVYFGSRIDSAKRVGLVSLLIGKYQRAQLLNMREKRGCYQLDIEPA
jgi:hypothetical protein